MCPEGTGRGRNLVMKSKTSADRRSILEDLLLTFQILVILVHLQNWLNFRKTYNTYYQLILDTTVSTLDN